MITVNGINLDEYLKDKTVIKDQLNREMLFKEGQSKIDCYHPSRSRFKPHYEKNGEVKILDQAAINQREYHDYMLEFIKDNNFKSMIVCILIADTSHLWFSSKEVCQILEEQSKIHGIKLTKNLNHVARWHMKSAYYSLLGDHMLIKRKGQTAFFRIKDEVLKTLSLKKAFELSEKRMKNGPKDLTKVTVFDRKDPEAIKRKTNKIRKAYQKNMEEKAAPQSPIAQPEKTSLETKPQENVPSIDKHQKAMDLVQTITQGMQKKGRLIEIHGDLHLHININL